LVAQASQVAEKVLSFVGRAFRHDIKSAFSSGVLTPEGPDTHISATCSACVLFHLAKIKTTQADLAKIKTTQAEQPAEKSGKLSF